MVFGCNQLFLGNSDASDCVRNSSSIFLFRFTSVHTAKPKESNFLNNFSTLTNSAF